MKNSFNLFVIATLVVAISLSMTGCPTEPDPPSPTVTAVTVSPATATVERGESLNFTATVLGTNDPPQSIQWGLWGNSSSGTAINSSGGLIVADNETSTTLTIQASSTFNRITVRGEATITVPQPTVTGVTIIPSSSSFVRGGAYTFTAVVTGTNDPPQDVTWEIGWVTGGEARSDTTTPDGTTINSSGGFMVSPTETLTTLTIRATSGGWWDYWRITGEATVTVLIPTLTSVEVSPATISVMRGGAQNFTATVLGENNPPQDVTWEIGWPNIWGDTEWGTSGPNGTTINSSGGLTVAAGETLRTLKVRATSTADDNIVGEATVTVPSGITGVTVSPATVFVGWDEEFSFTATVSGTNSPPQGVTWSVVGADMFGSHFSWGGILWVCSSDSHFPTLTVRATSVIDPTVRGEATVILPGSITSVTISPATASIARGGMQNFTATVLGTNNPPQDVTWQIREEPGWSWDTTTSNGTTINSSGGLTVATGETAGTLTVRATSMTNNRVIGEATVTIPEP